MIVVSLLSDSPRELLVRNAWVSAPLSLWTLLTLRAERPITFVTTRSLLPHLAAAMDELWATEPRFRAAWGQITVVWGVVLVLDAVLGVVMATRLLVDLVPGLDAGLTVGTLLLQAPTHLLLVRSGQWRRLFA
ncbi:MAG: VC0807 family protein [Jiangellaceae bacterium]